MTDKEVLAKLRTIIQDNIADVELIVEVAMFRDHGETLRSGYIEKLRRGYIDAYNNVLRAIDRLEGGDA